MDRENYIRVLEQRHRAYFDVFKDHPLGDKVNNSRKWQRLIPCMMGLTTLRQRPRCFWGITSPPLRGRDL